MLIMHYITEITEHLKKAGIIHTSLVVALKSVSISHKHQRGYKYVKHAAKEWTLELTKTDMLFLS